MSTAANLRRIGSALVLSVSLAGCSSDPEPSAPTTQSCDSLLATLTDAELEVELAPGLAENADSDGGATVTAGEEKEIQQIAERETAAREAATAAGCL